MDKDLAELISLAKEGSKDAFGQIYALFYKRIFRFIYYLIYDKELAQDLTQNTFLKAWRALSSFSLDKGTLQAFLFTIAKNLVVDHQRKKREFPLDAADEVETKEDFEEDLDRESNKQMLQKALEVLDDFERQLIILRYFEELPFAEVSKIVGKEEGAVRVRVHRILGKLKEELERQI